MDEAIPHKIGLHEMTRVRAVWEHPAFQRELARLEELERDRPFCRHGIQHLLDTARIMRILNLEQGLGFSREVVYSTALLHDVGKAGQYAGGEPHEVAGERLAREILESAPPDTRFAPMTSTRCVSPSAGIGAFARMQASWSACCSKRTRPHAPVSLAPPRFALPAPGLIPRRTSCRSSEHLRES